MIFLLHIISFNSSQLNSVYYYSFIFITVMDLYDPDMTITNSITDALLIGDSLTNNSDGDSSEIEVDV